MEFLGLDPAEVRAIVRQLIVVERRAEQVAITVRSAESLAELDSGAGGRLDQVGSDLLGVASTLAVAADRADDFVLPLDRASMTAAHNTYFPGRSIDAAADAGVRVFELDIHRGPPTRWRGDALPVPAAIGAVVVDHLRRGDGTPGSWSVYHHSLDAASAYPTLAAGLAAVARAADTGEGPVTIFIDIKDPFGGSHSPAALDQVLREGLGDRLFTPNDLLATAPGAETLQHAVQQVGWPELRELDGRVIVALTDKVDGYGRHDHSQPGGQVGDAAFVVGPAAGFDPHAATVIWNAHAATITAAEIAAIRDHANLIRVWGQGAHRLDATFRARDIGPP